MGGTWYAMKLIVGLGNPGREYRDTRHNVGFRVVDVLAERAGVSFAGQRFSGLPADARIGGEKVLLLKPQTYMNLSGRSVREAMSFHKLEPAELLVIVDDLALPLGRLRVRARGSPGGHNGLISVSGSVGTDEYARLRLGIEWVAGKGMVGHVLGRFSPEEEEMIGPAVFRAADAATCWITDGIDAAMNRFNSEQGPKSG